MDLKRCVACCEALNWRTVIENLILKTENLILKTENLIPKTENLILKTDNALPYTHIHRDKHTHNVKKRDGDWLKSLLSWRDTITLKSGLNCPYIRFVSQYFSIKYKTVFNTDALFITIFFSVHILVRHDKRHYRKYAANTKLSPSDVIISVVHAQK